MKKSKEETREPLCDGDVTVVKKKTHSEKTSGNGLNFAIKLTGAMSLITSVMLMINLFV